MLDPEVYTVAWICRSTTELIAARTFLDETHEGPEHLAPNDNIYVLGRTGQHNVVIAILPEWASVINPGTIGVRHMILRFPNMRVSLIVGIGGGVPSPKHDIRLGDIVVGVNGVHQYDYGMTTQRRKWHQDVLIEQPPASLCAAVTRLKATHELEGHRMEVAVGTILEQRPPLRERFGRRVASTDPLYKREVVHPSVGSGICAETCGDESTLVVRPQRDAADDDPVVHHGLIATSFQQMKDALLRDEIAEETGVLCFENEVAGIPNRFPSLVIRGISDYSDSHKNENWQGYAAMTAAAYAYDLLTAIPRSKIEAERRINEVLLADGQFPAHAISYHADSLVVGEHLESVMDTVGAFRVSDEYNGDQMISWLSPLDLSANYLKVCSECFPDSGRWLLRNIAYKRWITERNSFLWLSGIPGCGKTFLSAIIIDDLHTRVHSHHVFYFFFDFADKSKQSLENMLCSLIIQLYDRSQDSRKHLDFLYSSCENKRKRPSIDSLRTVFEDMIRQAGEVWIILDALDECQNMYSYVN